MRRPARSGATVSGGLLLVVAVAGILRATVGSGFSIAPMRIPAAWCLICGPGWLMDGVSNVVLFLPLGAALALLGVRPSRAAAGAGLLSLSVELLQAAGIPALRSPSAADVMTNSLGGLGAAWLTLHAPTLWRPPRQLARRLLLGWMGAVGGTLILTTLALQPILATSGATDATVRPSPHAYAPGYGWYGGRLHHARINAVAFPDRDTGPVVAEVPALPDRIRVEVALIGRDTLGYQRAMVFLHPHGDTVPVALLTQDGPDLRWELRTRGYRWGLAKPSVRLRDIIPTGVAADGPPLRLEATVTPGALTLSARRPGRNAAHRVATAFTPVVGWALLQSVVRLADPGAAAVQCAWLLVLLAPLTRWGRLLGRRWMLGSSAGVGVTIIACDLVGGLAGPTMADWTMVVVALAIGAAPWEALLRSAGPPRYIA